jgi:DNA primase
MENFKIMTEETVLKIKGAADLKAVAQSVTTLKRTGGSYTCQCPKCSGKKLSITPAKEVFKCFNCEWGGKAGIAFLMGHENIEYGEALHRLAKQFNIAVEYQTETVTKKILFGITNWRVAGCRASNGHIETKKTIPSKWNGIKPRLLTLFSRSWRGMI